MKPAIRNIAALVMAALPLVPPASAATPIDTTAPDQAITAVINAANGALRRPLYSVVDKTQLPASGNPHDYFSFAPYWWPDPDTSDGLPYVRRDGHYNDATLGEATDKRRLIDFVDTVNTLASAYRYSHDEHYAERAVSQLRHWFIASDTRMNPSLRYAQAIPGRNDGRGIGIIESRQLIDLARSIDCLSASTAMDAGTLTGLKQWYADYLDWMRSSDNGKDEHAKRNNHGTWYDAQVVAFARFTNRPELARRQLRSALSRLDTQIAPDGRQPLELERTRPWHYVNFNLEAWSILLDEAEAIGMDWPQGSDRRRLAAAYHWVADRAAHPADWPYDELHGFHPAEALPSLMAARRHDLISTNGDLDAMIHRWIQNEKDISTVRLLALFEPVP